MAVWSDACALGRSGERAATLDLRLDATLGGRPLLRDGLKYPEGADSPAVLGGHRHVGSVHLFGRRAMSSSCPKGTPTSPYLQLASPGTTARGLAADAAGLERALGAVRATFLSVIGPSLKEVPVHG